VKQGQDGYGQMLLAALEGRITFEIVERDDGFVDAAIGARLYLAPFRRWPAVERQAMRFVRGRTLDVGCGGGRVCLHLQDRGQEVVGIDISPGAVEVCRRRGVRDVRLCSIDDVDESLGVFDTIVMLGNNFGLVANATKAKRLLRRFHRLTSERGRIVAETRDVYRTNDPAHLAYQERNRARGRMSGQIRLRVRYRDHATPWFDYLMVSQPELEGLLEGTGWYLERVLESEDMYLAVIQKTEREKAAPAEARRAASGSAADRAPRRSPQPRRARPTRTTRAGRTASRRSRLGRPRASRTASASTRA
jgi:SAM-dependent methyltransferase